MKDAKQFLREQIPELNNIFDSEVVDIRFSTLVKLLTDFSNQDKWISDREPTENKQYLCEWGFKSSERLHYDVLKYEVCWIISEDIKILRWKEIEP
jgi:hypothetical protein